VTVDEIHGLTAWLETSGAAPPPGPAKCRVTDFQVLSPLTPQGDQPRAIEQLVAGYREGKEKQVLLGVTGSGKTFTMAKVVEALNRPTLVLSHNKTLAAQLYQEFKSFFPRTASSTSSRTTTTTSRRRTSRSRTRTSRRKPDQRRDRQAPDRGHGRALRAARRADRGVGLVHLRPRQPRVVREDGDRDREGARYGMTWYLKRLVEAQYERTTSTWSRGSFRVRGDVLDIVPVVRGPRPPRGVLRRRDRADTPLRDR
jgi:excinuclease ABC subunit B